MIAAVSPPLLEPAKSQFLRPTATDLRALSAALLSISMLPLPKNFLSATSLFTA